MFTHRELSLFCSGIPFLKMRWIKQDPQQQQKFSLKSVVNVQTKYLGK